MSMNDTLISRPDYNFDFVSKLMALLVILW